MVRINFYFGWRIHLPFCACACVYNTCICFFSFAFPILTAYQSTMISWSDAFFVCIK
ncbi:hypothetical protein BDC45DRAFT_519848 [Circinella umbellata]|nr:hypothetical protein BDC45DRAFT_519848 [Circinella umbellata]